MFFLKGFANVSIIGITAGLINGFFGSGGGTVDVLSMERFLKTNAHKAHATAVAVILPMSILSAFIYANSMSVKWLSVLVISAGGIAGGLIGAKLLSKLSAGWLHKIFGTVMVIAGVGMIFLRKG